MKLMLLSCAIVLLAIKSNAQSVGIGTSTPNSSAMLDVFSNNKGLLLPRVSLSAANDAATISSPATGLIVYNTNAGLGGGTGIYYNAGTPGAPQWTKLGAASGGGWLLTGNAGTDTATNFLGTTDYKPLKFRVNNQRSGFIDALTSSSFFGFQAGQYHTFANNTRSTGFGHQVMSVHTGSANTAMGAFAMMNNNQFGNNNAAVGFQSLMSNTQGNHNVAMGSSSMYSNTSGTNNVAIGDSAFFSNLSGSNNVAIGPKALKDAVSVSANVGIGLSALEVTTAGLNTAVGNNSLKSNTTGSANTAVGHGSLTNNISGIRNAAFGYRSMEDNNSGNNNTAAGYAAMASITSGDDNTALGYIALNGVTSGNDNVAIGSYALAGGNYSGNVAVGYEAMRVNNNSSVNIAIGRGALKSMSYTNGGLGWPGYNIAIGTEALYANQPNSTTDFNVTNGIKNLALGHYALHDNTTGRDNLAIGHESMNNNTVGYANTALGVETLLQNSSGNSNLALGLRALRSNTNGDNNVAVGGLALYSNTSAFYNTAVGYTALNANTTGGGNTALGYSAGSFNDNSSYCTYLGRDADQSVSTDFTNSTAIGYLSRITASNQVRIGNSAVGSIGGYAAWSNISDGRFKRNIRADVKGLDFIMALRPVTYNLDMNGLAAFMQEDRVQNDKGQLEYRAAALQTVQQRTAASQVVHTGFVAQEVAAAAAALHYDFSGIDKPTSDQDLYALRYSEFVVPLVKAVQEQQAIISNLQQKIAQMEALLLHLSAKQ